MFYSMTQESPVHGYRLRHPEQKDIPSIAQLIRSYDTALLGFSHATDDEVAVEWKRPGFDPATDAWLFVTGDETPAGYQSIMLRSNRTEFMADGYVHPAHTGRGLGTAQLRLMEDRAREMLDGTIEGKRVTIRCGAVGSDGNAANLFRNEGYVPVRYFREMRIDLETTPPEPRMPDGITLAPFRPGKDERALFDALEEAFRDHWGYTAWDYGWWLSSLTEREGYTPELWLVAMDGDEIAGAAVCSFRDGTGWVNQLGVRPKWRKRGIGLALLGASFHEFARRGTLEVSLGVDADNPTGAFRLYERAGMSVTLPITVFAKEIRPGERT